MPNKKQWVTERHFALAILLLTLFGIVAGTNWDSLINKDNSSAIFVQGQRAPMENILSISEMVKQLKVLLESPEGNVENIDYICSKLADSMSVNSIVVGKFVYTKPEKDKDT